ncbi:hypothetical protein MLD38_033803 [Melastoma candidum]|uniref:Uncharacterized protein n=1 Tax=Melastoma candidum TaxID=119954 RepID=A0ACB9M7W9_9MYRT|nr:hypothetical protein MLD38_033803 [Melastoma candidum]
MDSETALELVKRGATLLLLDVPPHSLVGIDTQVFSVGPAFRGIKMIPPGPHFIYYSSSSRDGRDFSPITGFFVDAGPSEVFVRRWDQQERLAVVTDEEAERYCHSVKNMEFDRYLGPYDINRYGDWKRLSSYLNKDIIQRLEPIGGDITVGSEPEMFKGSSKTAMEKNLDEQLRKSKFSITTDESRSRGCYYTSIPHVIKRRDVQGHELTSLNLDKTQLLESMLEKHHGGIEDSILGELQFAFISFLMGQSLQGFLQWKSLVSLFLECTEAPFHTRSYLFTKFIKVIYHQLKYGLQKESTDGKNPEHEASALLDESWLSTDSFMHRLGKEFFSLVLGASVVDGELLSWTRRLKELLENTLGWNFSQNWNNFDEDDEFAPRVEIIEDQ